MSSPHLFDIWCESNGAMLEELRHLLQMSHRSSPYTLDEMKRQSRAVKRAQARAAKNFTDAYSSFQSSTPKRI